jgi:two-component system, NarL family, response regulator DesR
MNRSLVELMDSTAASIFAELDSEIDERPLAAAVCARDAGLRDRAADALRSDGIEVCATTTGGDELLTVLGRQRVDAAICVISEADEDVPSVEALRARPPGSSLVIAGFATSRARLRRMLDLGAQAFVLEWQMATALAPAVRAACSGLVSVPAELSQNVERGALTRRQREVLRLAVRGSANAEIAERLYLSESTVKAHLSAAFRKIGVKSRCEAAALLLDPEVARSFGIVGAARALER